jgi:GNAT superfamily N-acetyltransferase
MSDNLVEFRYANQSEAEELALVFERATAGRDEMFLPTEIEDTQDVGYVEERMNRIEAITRVATWGQNIIGFAISHPLIETESSSDDIDTEHLSLLMIDPDYWGRRVASVLLNMTIDHARDIGRSHLTLWTRAEDNDRAQGVYKHKGFSPTGVFKDTDHGTQFHYRLDL